MRRLTRMLTLAVAAAIFVVGGVVGFELLTQGTDKVAQAETCTASVITAGSELNSNVVTVNVFNASNRSGLANRALIELQANGFLGGQIGNSTSATKPNRVAILTADAEDPRVKLVAAQFRDKVEFAPADLTVDEGIVIVVGDNYRGLKKKAAVTTITTDRDIPVCVPVIPDA